MFKINKYSKCYYSIIDRAKSRESLPNIYTEKHHIIPKSCGGDNTFGNLVRLTAREHFVCHLLLPKMVEGKFRNKMIHALWRMCNSLKTDYKVNSKTYTKTREQHAQVLSTVGTSGQFKIGRTTWNKGIPRTVEEKQRMSLARTGIKTGRTRETFTDDWKEKISLSAKTRMKKTCLHCNKETSPTNYSRWHGDNCRTKS
jgi:hypothetical protein